MDERPQFRLLEKLRHRKHHHRRRGRLYRSGFVIAGIVLTIIGLIMFVTPGPAMVVFPIGLYLLALEFDWAERLLHRALRHADRTVRSPFVEGTVRFAKQHPKLTAAIVAILITLGAALFVSLWNPQTIPKFIRNLR